MTPLGIGLYNVSDNVCDNLIDYFNNNKEHHKVGTTNNNGNDVVEKNIKDSIELSVVPNHPYFNELQICLTEYVSSYPELNDAPVSNINENVNIQKYPKGGGFKRWHWERNDYKTIKRSLVFMTYLNNTNGGTEFKYQNWTAPCTKGLTLIWPADWLFTHRGIVDSENEKIIITGWISWN